MTVRILRCNEFPRLVDNKYQVVNVEKNQFNIKVSPAYLHGNTVVTSLKFAANEIEVIDW
jgi:hypothetical protein